jgi:PAS domain S-box-containing protein
MSIIDPQSKQPSDDLTKADSANRAFAARRNTEKPLWFRLAWLPIPLLLLTMAVFADAKLGDIHDSFYLRLALNFVFLTLVFLFVAYLVGRSFLSRSTPGLLLLGCGVLIWGVGAVASIVLGRRDVNVAVTIFNLGACLAALCHLAGVSLSLRPKRALNPAGLWLASGYVVALLALGLISIFTIDGRLPIFFVEGQGSTTVRHLVLGSAVAMFALAAILLRTTNRKSLSPFAYWYSYALALFAVGLFGTLFPSSFSSVLFWTARTTQWLGGVYMLIAAIASVRESRVWGIYLEAALQQQSDLLRLSFDAIIVWCLGGVIESWNRGAEQLYGYSESEALGRVTHELLKTIHPMPWQEVEARLRKSGNWEGELRHFTKEGREVVVSARHQLVVGADGVERILETNRNITDRKRAEEALRASEERWSTTLRSIGDAVIATDANGRVTFMNEVAAKLTGWQPSEAQGRALEEVFNIVNEVTRIKPENPVANVIRMGQVVGLANHTALIGRNGTELPIEDSGAPIRDKDGQVTGVVLVFHDISDKRRAEKALRDSERLAMTGRMAATLAHEIHNPLDTVGGLLFLIDQNPDAPETVRQQASTAGEELARVTQMTRHMLSFQREAKNPVPIKIGEVLDNVFALYERKIESAGIQVEKQVDFEGEFIGLPGEIRQVFANLIGNAIEAIGKNGKIRLHAYASRDWRRGRRGLRVTVTDNGSGIPAEVRDKIFDPFFTTKGEAGTGLGLWIISGIIADNDGALRLRTVTRDGRSGTCFSVFFPFPS